MVKSKSKSGKAMMAAPARKRRKSVPVIAAPRRRRRKTLSAGSMAQVIALQIGSAILGGMAGKAMRNAMPESLSPEIKTVVISGIGVAAAKFSKNPLFGAGIIGSGGAYYASSLGLRFGIPLLSEQNAQYVLM